MWWEVHLAPPIVGSAFDPMPGVQEASPAGMVNLQCS